MLFGTYLAVAAAALPYVVIATAVPQLHARNGAQSSNPYTRCKPSTTSSSTSTTSSTTTTKTTTTSSTTTTRSAPLTTCSNYIADASFEQIDVDKYDGTYNFATGDWIFTGNDATVGDNSEFNQYIAYSGSQFAVLQTDISIPPSSVFISQIVFDLVVGKPYSLSYFYILPDGLGISFGNGVESCTVTASIAGQTFPVVLTGADNLSQWAQSSQTFVATTDTDTLTIMNSCTTTAGDGGTIQLLIDEVTIELNDGSCIIDYTPDGVSNPNKRRT